MPIAADVFSVVVLEGSIALLMQGDHKGHDFAETQLPSALTCVQPRSEQPLSPLRLVGLAKVIDGAEKFFEAEQRAGKAD